MKEKFLKLAIPIGVLCYVIYSLINRFIVKLPDAIAIPFCFLSILLIMIGLVNNRYSSNKDKKPNDFTKVN